jgi:acyl-CoA thioester hydrolase
MNPISHIVHYYETDKMGVTHHSNYIRWMENARIEFLDEIGCGYAQCEEMGLTAPVLAFSCEIKKSTHFAEEVLITAKLASYTGVRISFSYLVTSPEGEPIASGSTSHCFTDKSGKVIALQKTFPELHERLTEELKREQA